MKKAWHVLLLLLAVIMLVGCSGGDGDSDSSEQNVTTEKNVSQDDEASDFKVGVIDLIDRTKNGDGSEPLPVPDDPVDDGDNTDDGSTSDDSSSGDKDKDPENPIDDSQVTGDTNHKPEPEPEPELGNNKINDGIDDNVADAYIPAPVIQRQRFASFTATHVTGDVYDFKISDADTLNSEEDYNDVYADNGVKVLVEHYVGFRFLTPFVLNKTEKTITARIIINNKENIYFSLKYLLSNGQKISIWTNKNPSVEGWLYVQKNGIKTLAMAFDGGTFSKLDFFTLREYVAIVEGKLMLKTFVIAGYDPGNDAIGYSLLYTIDGKNHESQSITISDTNAWTTVMDPFDSDIIGFLPVIEMSSGDEYSPIWLYNDTKWVRVVNVEKNWEKIVVKREGDTIRPPTSEELDLFLNPPVIPPRFASFTATHVTGDVYDFKISDADTLNSEEDYNDVYADNGVKVLVEHYVGFRFLTPFVLNKTEKTITARIIINNKENIYFSLKYLLSNGQKISIWTNKNPSVEGWLYVQKNGIKTLAMAFDGGTFSKLDFFTLREYVVYQDFKLMMKTWVIAGYDPGNDAIGHHLLYTNDGKEHLTQDITLSSTNAWTTVAYPFESDMIGILPVIKMSGGDEYAPLWMYNDTKWVRVVDVEKGWEKIVIQKEGAAIVPPTDDELVEWLKGLPIIDVTSPVVLSTYPENSETGIGLDISPIVEFDELMDPLTLNLSNIYITNTFTGVVVDCEIVTSIEGRAVKLDPISDLESLIKYMITVDGPTDSAGNLALVENVEFTTGNFETPYIVSTYPENNSTDFPVDGYISINVSEVIDTFYGVNVELNWEGINIPGLASYTSSDNIIIFDPSEDLEPGEDYVLIFSDSNVDIYGNNFEEYLLGFTTAPLIDITGPVLISTDPVDNELNCSVHKTLKASFNEDILPASVSMSTVNLFNEAGDQIVGTYHVTGGEVSFNPSSLLQGGDYVWILDGVTDLEGNFIEYVEIDFNVESIEMIIFNYCFGYLYSESQNDSYDCDSGELIVYQSNPTAWYKTHLDWDLEIEAGVIYEIHVYGNNLPVIKAKLQQDYAPYNAYSVSSGTRWVNKTVFYLTSESSDVNGRLCLDFGGTAGTYSFNVDENIVIYKK